MVLADGRADLILLFDELAGLVLLDLAPQFREAGFLFLVLFGLREKLEVEGIGGRLHGPLAGGVLLGEQVTITIELQAALEQ